MAAKDTPVPGTAKLGGAAAWYALTLVTLATAISLVDRQILAILAPRIKADLHIGDAEMGVLFGAVFGLFYSVFSLPLGRLADGWVRTKLLSLSIFGWSIMTAVAGFANSFGVLAISRLGVGVGEASSQPAGMSLLSDMFPKSQRGTITAAISIGVALGVGGALWLGGAVADSWDNAYANGGAPFGFKGWQAAFLVAAAPGIVLALLFMFIKEPVRGAADGVIPPPDPAPFKASLDTLIGILPGLAWLEFLRRKAPPKLWIINIAAAVIIIAAAFALTQWTNVVNCT